MSTVDINAKGDVSIFGDVVGRDKITINLPPPLPPAEAKDRANLLILLHKVKTFWIEGVLEKSVHNAVLLELGKETKPEAVEHPWEMVLELPDQTNQVLPSGTKIIDIFEKMNRALLLLGEPGSGKTITLLELARDLITRAEADPTQPIPVVFNLSSWIDKRQLFVDWLMVELSIKYQMPKKIGRAWLEDNRILPLLDGLDEVKPENRAACVEAINHFGETFGLPGRVVCSRIKEYTALPVRLKLNGAICLQPLTFTQVNNYLQADSNKLAALSSTLRKDEALQELAHSPLMLNIMSLAYQDLPIDDLACEVLDTEGDRRKHLFDTYISRMFLRKGKSERFYSKDQTIHWLSWLAQKMTEHFQTVFLIEGIQPSWIRSSWQRLTYSFGLFAIGGLGVGLSAGVFWFMRGIVLEDNVGSYKISIWLTAGLIWGLSIGLVHAFKSERWDQIENDPKKSRLFVILTIIVTCWVVWALIWTVIWLQVWGIDGGLTEILYPLLTGTLISLFGGAWYNKKRTIINKIQMTEAFGWSWASAKKGSVWGVGGGLFVWGVYMLVWGSSWEYADETLLYDLLMVTILGAISFGLNSRIVKTKSMPNQGIKLSLKNSIMAGSIFGMLLGMTHHALTFLLYRMHSINTLFVGLGAFLIAGLWYGGWDALMHFMLRLSLYFERNTPCRYAHFLDYATKLIFLQKVGGGYIFIHRLLLEHFAAMPLQSKTQKK